MCGICGILKLTPDAAVPGSDLLDRMTDTLAHRGPDDRGCWRDERIALGHRRLSVIDLSRAGRQPMGNEDGSIQIVYNGEVYNYLELKERYDLVGRGHLFRSRTDTEVLLHLYEEIGLDMVSQLNGMFAMGIWDARNAELHLIRDRYGIKPLFYQQDESHFRFGSEIKALIADPRVKRRVCHQALYDYLTFNYVPGVQTAFDGIHEVPVGHTMTITTDGRCSTSCYWDLSFDEDESITEKTAIDRSLELMDRAVQRRLIGDVPIGVLLSGGMDSSALVALMHRHTSEPIHTYSVGFEDDSFNELPYARSVSRQFGTISREVVVTPQLVREMLPAYLRFIDEPYGDGSAIPTYYVCQLAKDEVVVVLSGEGGDEVFGGYDTYMAYKASRQFKRIPRWIRNGLLAPLAHLLPVSHSKLSFEFKVKRFLGGQDLSPAQAHLWWRVVMDETRKRELCSPEVGRQISLEPADQHFLEVFRRSEHATDLSRLMHIDSRVFLPDDLMVKTDRMSMAHSLEARVPFTDPELTEYLSRVPSRLKIRRGRKKHLMREALRGLLPRRILDKKKVGLEMPYSRWLKHELKDILLTYCGPDRIADTGLFRPQVVQSMIDNHAAGRRDEGRPLWGLLNFMMWHELYIA